MKPIISSPDQADASPKQRKVVLWLLLAVCCFVVLWWLKPVPNKEIVAAKPAGNHSIKVKAFAVKQGRLHNFANADEASSKAKSSIANVLYMFDSNHAAGITRFLVGAKWDREYLPDTDQIIGQEMWLSDEAGNERLVHPSVRRAVFSPDGSKIAYTTTDFDMHVETVTGEKIATLPRAYDPSWRQDGNEIAFARAPEGNELDQPDQMQIGTWDYKANKVQTLTTGEGYDHLPQYVPSGDQILFVSAGRSGWASFYVIPTNGGEPIELTTEGMNIPVPYARTMWSKDGRWFIYDAKDGDTQETWALEIDAKGHLLQSAKLADALDPQVMDDGTIVSIRHDGEERVPVVSRLPGSKEISPSAQRVIGSVAN